MKINKLLISILVMSLVFLLAGCEFKTRPETEPGEADAEVAMENFLDKIADCNYIIETKDYAKISVCSPDAVYVDYSYRHYQDFAILTLDNKTYRVNLEEREVDSVYYYGEDCAIDTVGDSLLHQLLNYEVTGGNIWNIFYNVEGNNLQFVSYSEAMQELLIKIAGIGPMAVSRMQEIYLTLNAENPTEAHLTMSFSEGYTPLDDIDVRIKFGLAGNDWRYKEWLEDENRMMPAAITEWDGNHETVLETVFFHGYGLKAVPFTTFATYAFTMDFANFVYSEQVVIRDANATLDAMNEYIALLKEKGFEEKVVDGETCYLLPLRAETHCYSAIYLEYNDGVDMLAEKYYDEPIYEAFDEANAKVQEKGFIPMTEPTDFEFMYAVDKHDAEIEGYLFLFDYDLMLYEFYAYDNEDDVIDYLDAYIELLLDAGFNPIIDNFAEGTGVSYYQLKTPTSSISFRYHFNGDGTVIFLYKSEKYIDPVEVNELLASKNFPTLNGGQIQNSRDITQFHYYEFGNTYEQVLTVTVQFETEAEAIAFLDQYADTALQTFDISSHAETGIDRQFVVYNEELDIALGFTYYAEELYANFEFLVY